MAQWVNHQDTKRATMGSIPRGGQKVSPNPRADKPTQPSILSMSVNEYQGLSGTNNLGHRRWGWLLSESHEKVVDDCRPKLLPFANLTHQNGTRVVEVDLGIQEQLNPPGLLYCKKLKEHLLYKRKKNIKNKQKLTILYTIFRIRFYLKLSSFWVSMKSLRSYSKRLLLIDREPQIHSKAIFITIEESLIIINLDTSW